jgi:putative redox protein
MPTIHTIYLGDLHTEAEHVKSGVKLITDAPPDNQGKGESFSPTDLLSASLGSCMMTIMAIAARTAGFEPELKGTEINITKIMASEPRRVGEIMVEFNFPPNQFSEKQKKMLENAARACPVVKSLHEDLKETIIFNW